MLSRIILVSALIPLASCAVGPSFTRPVAPAGDSYGAVTNIHSTASSAVTGGQAQHFTLSQDIPGDWWSLFRSPQLSALVEQALKANPDLSSARAALRQAHELYLAQRASFWPTLQGGFTPTRAKNALATIANPTALPQQDPYYNLYTAGVSVSYVPDIFGGSRRAVEAAKAQTESARFQYEATYVTLTSNVVVTAIQEASLRAQVAATERMVALQHQLTETVHGQRSLGTASNVDVLTQETAEAQTAATLPALRKQLGQMRDALTALLGRLPSGEPAEQFHLEDLTLPTELPVTLPSKLVEQRPDVRQAEENIHAASAQVGVALADMLPQVQLTADLGSTALGLNQLFGPYTGFWTVGASLSQILFDGGALRHRKRAADAALDQAADQYRAAVILAFQNVADTLRALQADGDALKANADADRAAKQAFDLARRQHALGTISFVALLNTEQSYEQAELALAQAQANRYSDTAALFQALGGGWWNHKEGDIDD